MIGPEQSRPTDFGAELRNIKFKDAFVQFLIDHWNSQVAANFLKDKELYVSYEKCFRYKIENNIVQCQVVNDYLCTGHEEADTKITYFLSRMENNSEVVVQCSDTDIMIIILGNMMHFRDNVKIWLQFGTGNNRRLVNVNKIYSSLGKKVCEGLPAFHAFTGCDFNPSFYRVGKKKPWALYANNPKFQQAFIDIQNPGCENYQ